MYSTTHIFSKVAHLKETLDRISLSKIAMMSELIYNSLTGGGCLYICGNGGSAADAQHLAAEFVGRYKKDRPPLRAIALTTDTSLLTAIGNDYGFNAIYERQVQAHMRANDILLCISTSGRSENILHAAHAAKKIGATVLSLTGYEGGALAPISDISIVVASTRTDTIQEAHLVIEHCLVEGVEALL